MSASTLVSAVLTDDRSPAELGAKASQAISEGNKNLAIYYYTQALLRDPSQTRWREWIAQAHFDRGDQSAAKRHAKLVLKADPTNARARAILAELSKPPAPPPSAEEEVALAEKAASSLPFPEKTSFVLPQGVAAWVIGNPMDHIQTINNYNQSAPKSQQIRFLFVPAGKLGITSGQLSLQFNPQAALQLAENLIGDVWVFPMIEGRSRGADRVAMPEWERIGQLIASKVEDERRLAGVYFEVEPAKGYLNALYAMTKNHTRKPVGAGGATWDALSFKYTDFMVLKAFNYDPDPRVQAGQLRSNTTGFLKDARTMEGMAFVGLPGVATTQEYESKARTPDGNKMTSGTKMPAYFENALAWLRRALVESDPAFNGVALWAFYSGDAVHGEYDQFWYYPSTLDPKILDWLKLPVAR